jgi:hypothetical protein
MALSRDWYRMCRINEYWKQQYLWMFGAVCIMPFNFFIIIFIICMFVDSLNRLHLLHTHRKIHYHSTISHPLRRLSLSIHCPSWLSVCFHVLFYVLFYAFKFSFSILVILIYWCTDSQEMCAHTWMVMFATSALQTLPPATTRTMWVIGIRHLEGGIIMYVGWGEKPEIYNVSDFNLLEGR